MMLFEGLLYKVLKDLTHPSYPTSFTSSVHCPLQTIGLKFTKVPQIRHLLANFLLCFKASPPLLRSLTGLIPTSFKIQLRYPLKIFPVTPNDIWFQILPCIPIKNND